MEGLDIIKRHSALLCAIKGLIASNCKRRSNRMVTDLPEYVHKLNIPYLSFI
ncbi:hypothetical protein HanHA89_Chr15g0624871 [Helianthus annuus]|nr:hypothetical protein HanHA89_Chr15g0624871 [Helianthus annuus]